MTMGKQQGRRTEGKLRLWLKGQMRAEDVWYKKVFPAWMRHLITRPIGKLVVHKTRKPKRYEPGLYPDGINLYGLLRSEIGLSQGAKLYAKAMEEGKIPHTLLNLDFMPDLPQNDTRYDDRLVQENKYAINVVHINPLEWRDGCGTFSQKQFDRHYNIIVILWELEKLPKSWTMIFRYVDEVWAPSQFIADAVRKETDKPVTVIPYGMETPYDESLTRADFGLSDEDFLVLMMFDSNSYASRKNPGAAIDAFREAYGENPEHVKLVIKINNPKAEDIAFVEEHIGGKAGYTLITERMDKERLNSLIRLCDVFLSLHRSEGYGLVLAEAMSLGTATVATNWSANTEFMPEGTACLVDYTMVPVGNAYRYELEGIEWADPDVHQAAEYLKRLHDEPAYMEQIVKAGQKQIREQLSVEKCAEKIRERLDEIIKNEE